MRGRAVSVLAALGLCAAIASGCGGLTEGSTCRSLLSASRPDQRDLAASVRARLRKEGGLVDAGVTVERVRRALVTSCRGTIDSGPLTVRDFLGRPGILLAYLNELASPAAKARAVAGAVRGLVDDGARPPSCKRVDMGAPLGVGDDRARVPCVVDGGARTSAFLSVRAADGALSFSGDDPDAAARRLLAPR